MKTESMEEFMCFRIGILQEQRQSKEKARVRSLMKGSSAEYGGYAHG